MSTFLACSFEAVRSKRIFVEPAATEKNATLPVISQNASNAFRNYPVGCLPSWLTTLPAQRTGPKMMQTVCRSQLANKPRSQRLNLLKPLLKMGQQGENQKVKGSIRFEQLRDSPPNRSANQGGHNSHTPVLSHAAEPLRGVLISPTADCSAPVGRLKTKLCRKTGALLGDGQQT